MRGITFNPNNEIEFEVNAKPRKIETIHRIRVLGIYNQTDLAESSLSIKSIDKQTLNESTVEYSGISEEYISIGETEINESRFLKIKYILKNRIVGKSVHTGNETSENIIVSNPKINGNIQGYSSYQLLYLAKHKGYRANFSINLDSLFDDMSPILGKKIQLSKLKLSDLGISSLPGGTSNLSGESYATIDMMGFSSGFYYNLSPLYSQWNATQDILVPPTIDNFGISIYINSSAPFSYSGDLRIPIAD